MFTRISHSILGKFEHLSHYLGRKDLLSKVYQPCLRSLLAYLMQQSVQFCCSICEKCGLSFLLLILPFSCFASHYQTVYKSLNPNSISQHLAFYELYPHTPQGHDALNHAWKLLNSSPTEVDNSLFSSDGINAIVHLVNKEPGEATLILNEHQLVIIEKLANKLSNRKLKGYYAKTEDDVIVLSPEEIDLARGLFLSEFSDLNKVRSYEALIDLMALQLLTRFSIDDPPEVKIQHINAFIFEEMCFRFPPHSVFAKNIDHYTFLPSVLDSRKGVCLGVSILYLCLAQRLDLPLEMVTPPGHIYIRYRDEEKTINIETTARGVHIEDDEYLSVETRSLQQRNIKEVIGMAHFNQASVYWHQGDNQKALESYKKAEPYMQNDPLLLELMAYNMIFVGDKEKGKKILESVRNYLPEFAVSKMTMAEDFLNGNVDEEGIQALFLEVDEKRESIEKKRNTLEKILEKFPKFRAGMMSLASTWLQLNRQNEALKILEKYHQIDPHDPTAEYYLAVLYIERYDYQKARAHLKNAMEITQRRDYSPKILKLIGRELNRLSPEVKDEKKNIYTNR